jgi:hypothetical protein
MHDKIDFLIKEGNLKDAAELIKQIIYSGKGLTKRHIYYAHVLLLASDWYEITSLLPKDTNHFITSGWISSVANGIPINNKGEPIPWFTYPAIDFLDSLKKENWFVFEWGCGYSTLWWSQNVKQVYSIEDNELWFNQIRNQIPNNVQLTYGCDKEAYVGAIHQHDINIFDVIVIDGSFRNECSLNSVNHLKDSGIIIFDNSDGKDYIESINFLIGSGFRRIDFWGLIPSYLYKNCTSVFFRDISFLDNIDIPPMHDSSVGISCFQAGDKLRFQQ